MGWRGSDVKKNEVGEDCAQNANSCLHPLWYEDLTQCNRVESFDLTRCNKPATSLNQSAQLTRLIRCMVVVMHTTTFGLGQETKRFVDEPTVAVAIPAE